MATRFDSRIFGSFAPDSSETKVWLDGFFTNRAELRALLSLAPGSTDLEIAVSAYKKWGVSSAARFEGSFALVVCDAANARLFAVRDPLGKRPLFYARVGGRVYFASDPASISALPEFSREPDVEAIAFLLHESHVLQDRTIFRGMSRLLPAHTLTVDGRGFVIRRYWEFEPVSAASEEIASRCRALLGEATRAALPESGRVGVFVSGGLDSAGIAAFASQATETSFFCGTFDDALSSNRGYPEAIAEFLGRPLRTSRPERELGEVDFEEEAEWENVYWEPSFFFFRPLLRLARDEGIASVLLGHGGDDLFLPAPSFGYDLLRAGRFSDLARQMGTRADATSSAARWLLDSALRPAIPEMAGRWGRRVLPKRAPEWIRRDFTRKHEVYARTAEILRRERRDIRARGLETRAAVDHYLRIFVSGGSSWQFEQHELMAMRLGIDFRYPYFDLSLVKFALSLRPEDLFWNGVTKVALRNALRGLIPEPIRTAEKFQDYVSLDRLSLWRQRERFRSYRKNLRLADIGAVDPKALERNWDRLVESGDTHVHYQILNLERWLRLFP